MEPVDLPVLPPLDPMLAKAAARVPDDPDTWSYEPKWDGFRALVFRGGDEVVLLAAGSTELTPGVDEKPGVSLLAPWQAGRHGRASVSRGRSIRGP